MTESMTSSARSEHWTQFLISTVASAAHKEAVLAQLILARIISTPSKDQISPALRTLKRIKSLATTVRMQEATALEPPTDDDLLAVVSADTSHARTRSRVISSLLGAIGRTVRPKGPVDWLGVAVLVSAFNSSDF